MSFNLLCLSQFKDDGGSEMKMGTWISFFVHFSPFHDIAGYTGGRGGG